MPTMENWSIVQQPSNGYTAPEARCNRLTGFVYQHSKFPDGKRVATSRIMSYDLVKATVDTHNAHYTLGAIDPLYLESFRESKPEVYKMWKGKVYTQA
jgi:hypothetical protein